MFYFAKTINYVIMLFSPNKIIKKLGETKENHLSTKSIFASTEEVLLKSEKYNSEDGKLLRNKVLEASEKMDSELLSILLSDKITKTAYFTKVNEIFVFDKQKFAWIIQNKNFLPDSYTRYKNKIGLINDKGEFIANSHDVELVFPYKDCILEGGQTKEDQKKDEIFYNETLAPDQVTNLLAPKAFCNAKKYDKDGVHEITEISDDDNLIIKGNNLLALSSLLEKYRGQVKCCYIDPPYNTGGDSFGYNDSFNHSTWLTFMKNRLELAKKLLSKDGVIFISINSIELSTLLSLCDEIFLLQNRLPIVTLKAGTTASYRAINECPVNVTEYVIGYTRNSETELNKVYRSTSYSEDYSHFITNINDKPEKWILKPIIDVIIESEGYNSLKQLKEKYGFNYSKIKYEKMSDFALKHRGEVVSLNTMQKPSEKVNKIIKLSKQNRNQVYEIQRDGKSSIYCYNGRSLAFYSKKFRIIDGEEQPSEILTNLWSDISFLGIGPEGAVTLMNGKKPEQLLERIFLLSTGEKDLILDFHLGSGTTAAVAHKMGRRYIGIEQLDYGENDSVIRLQNVINGDTTGISKSVNWQGGGSFVYCELAKLNQTYADQIQSCKTDAEIKSLTDEILKSDFVSSKVIPLEIDTNAEDYNQLSFADKQKFAMALLDKNQLYVNYSERNDSNMKLSEKDIKFSESFYNNLH